MINQRLQLLQSMNADPRWRHVAWETKARVIDEILKVIAFGPCLHVGPGPDPAQHTAFCRIWDAGGWCDCERKTDPPEATK